MKRKIEQTFAAWKEAADHNPLVIKGVRQCGKTYSVMRFAKANYKHVIYLNFFEDPRYKQVFEGSMNVDTICSYISSLLGPKVIFEPGSTCIVLDEIQECPNARTSLKFFKLDGRYDVICTGSLLGVKGYRENTVSVPVGYETVVNMYPLDFEEFLWANDIGQNIISQIMECMDNLTPVPEPLHGVMREKLLQYVVVGACLLS